MHVHHSSQLEVVLPISLNSNEEYNYSHLSNSTSQHSMMTRLKSRAIEKKHYAAFLATFPKLNALQITKDEPFFLVAFLLSLKYQIVHNQVHFEKLLLCLNGKRLCKRTMILLELRVYRV